MQNKKQKILSYILTFSILAQLGANFFYIDAYASNDEINTKIEMDKGGKSKGQFNSKNINTLSNSKTTDEKYIEGEVIIKYKNNKLSAFKNKVKNLENNGLQSNFEIKSKGIVGLSSNSKKTKDLIKELKNDPDVEYVQPNYIYEVNSFSSNDTYVDQQWGLNNTGQTVNSVTGIDDMDIDWPEAMNVFSGSTNTGIIVAVIDSGINYNHLDLKNKMWNGTNCVDDSGNALGSCITGYDFHASDNNPLDETGHGTHVAGIIAGESNNSFGITGVNPNVQIMNVRGLGSTGTTANLIKAVNFAKQNGAKIINASWGSYNLTGENCTQGNTPTLDLSLYNVIKDFRDAGGIFLAAAGNNTKNHDDPTQKMFPAGFGETFTCGDLTVTGLENIISVAAIDSDGGLSSFSDYGANSVDIGAPGSEIYSTYPGTINYIQNGSAYTYNSTGTTLPNYLTGAVGNWGINDTIWPGQYYDMYADMNYPYLTGTTSEIQSINYDLSNIPTNSTFFAEFLTECYLPANNNGDDYLTFSISNDGGQTYTENTRYNNDGYKYYHNRISIPSDYWTNQFKFKFTWVSGSDENVLAGCNITPAFHLYYQKDDVLEYLDGTSMATPFVTGLASLAWAYRSDLGYSDIKTAILNNGDDLASLSGTTLSGKKINAYNTLISLSQITDLSNLKIYEDESKQVEILTGTTINSPYVEWNDTTNSYTLSGYTLEVKDGSGEVVFSGNTTNKYLTGITISKSGDYNFSVYSELLNSLTGGLVTSGNITFDLNPYGNIDFTDGAFTNTGITELTFTTTKASNYTISGDILNTLTGSTSTGETLNIDLSAGDGTKNISIDLEDQDQNLSTITGSIILDTTSPVISEVNINDNDKFSTGSITLTGVITDTNLDTLTINNSNVTLSNTGYFETDISLSAGDNSVNISTTDKAGNTTSSTINVIRIGNAPAVSAVNTSEGFDIIIANEFVGTGVILYGTGDLDNTLTGTYSTGETISIPALSQTTYYYKAYFINNGYDSLVSDTGSITTQNLGPSGNITFSDGEYTNTGTTEIYFTTTKASNYTISGDVLNTITGSTSSGETLNIDLSAGDGTKNISILLEDQNSNTNSITGSIILDTTSPVISEINISDNDKFSTGSITLTGVITDTNLDTLTINNSNVTLSNTGYFTTNVSLSAGDNSVNISTTDKAGNTTSSTINVIRIGKAPTITASNSFGKVKFTISNEFAGTGVILYGTGNLDNTLTGTYGTGESLSISVLSKTTYYYKAYFINNGYDSLISSTGSIETLEIIDENTSGNHTITGSTTIGNATSTGVVFTQTGTLNINSNSGSSNSISLPLSGLTITTRDGNWDGIINPPTETTGTGNITLSGYERLSLTFKAGSDVDSLTFSGAKAQVTINVGSSYNGKTFKVYRSGDNQQTFTYIDECLVSNSLCTFETSEFSHFTFMSPTTSSSSGGSSSGGGGGSGAGFRYSTCTASQLQCVNGVYKVITGEKCSNGNLGKTCEVENKITIQTNIKKEELTFKGYSYTKYDGDSFSEKIEKVIKKIVSYDKVDDDVKESFITNLNNFQNARYELMSAKVKDDNLKFRYKKYSIILRSSIKKLNENIIKNSTKVVVVANKTAIVKKPALTTNTIKNTTSIKKETYKVTSYSVKLYLDSSFKTLTAWVKTGDEVELVEDLGDIAKVKITKSYAERYVGRTGYIYKYHLEKQ